MRSKSGLCVGGTIKEKVMKPDEDLDDEVAEEVDEEESEEDEVIWDEGQWKIKADVKAPNPTGKVTPVQQELSSPGDPDKRGGVETAAGRKRRLGY